MGVVDNESDGNIDSLQNTFSRGYETVLGSADDESYYNLAIRNKPSNISSEERNGAISGYNQEDPYEVPEAVLRAVASTARSQGDSYQELRHYENTVIRSEQDGPYEVIYLNPLH